MDVEHSLDSDIIHHTRFCNKDFDLTRQTEVSKLLTVFKHVGTSEQCISKTKLMRTFIKFASMVMPVMPEEKINPVSANNIDIHEDNILK